MRVFFGENKVSLDSVSVSNQSLIITGLSTDTKPTTTMSATNKFLETDTGDVYEYSGNSWIKLVESGAIIAEPNQIAHERNIGTANQYGVGVSECNAMILDGTSAVAVSDNVAALVFGVLIITSGTTATIVGLYDQVPAAKSIVLTSSAASQFFDLKGMKVDTTFTVTASVDDDVVVFWRPQ